MKRHRLLVGATLSVLAVLILCRGLLFGNGGYELYVDSALPASSTLLHGICQQTQEIWSTDNLGQRVLFPNEYLVCGGIAAGLDLGIPADLLSRLVPVLALCVASLGMFILLMRLGDALRAKVEDRATAYGDITAALATAVFYSCSPYSFTEVVAGHWLCLVAIAAIPWAALILANWTRSLTAVIAAGTVLSVAYSQTQFMLIAPASLMVVGILVGRREFTIRSIVSSIIGFIPHLPWMLPLAIYRPSIQVSTYIPASETSSSINPLNSLRLVGYITPFTENSVRGWFHVWYFLSFCFLVIALYGLVRLRPLQSNVLGSVMVLAIWYQWGALSPGYGVWSHLVPGTIQALFRERYILSYFTLIILSFTLFVGLRVILGVNVRAAHRVKPSRHMVRWTLPAFVGLRVILAVDVRATGHVKPSRHLVRWTLLPLVGLVLIGSVGSFLDGHLGPYGIVREDFATESAVAQYIDTHGGGTVLTIPLGSIVREPTWPPGVYGRNPFSLGDPAHVLDPESGPAASGLPIVQALAQSLIEPRNTDPDITAQYMQLLRVTFIVDFSSLQGYGSVNRTNIIDHLDHLGVRRVLSIADATIYRTPFGSQQTGVTTSPGLVVVGSLHQGAYEESQKWRLPLAVDQSRGTSNTIDAARLSGELLRLDQRQITVVRSGPNISVSEGAYMPQSVGLRTAEVTHSLVTNSRGALVFGDGTPIPQGTTTLFVSGPVDMAYAANPGSQPIGSDPATWETHVDLNEGSTLVQIPGGTGSAPPDLIITPAPLACSLDEPCKGDSYPTASHWVLDFSATDQWWKLDGTDAKETELLSNGVGKTWFVPNAQATGRIHATYLPEDLFRLLIAASIVVYGLVIAGASTIVLINMDLRVRLRNLGRVASRRPDRGESLTGSIAPQADRRGDRP